jgi:predicted dehydrogenase
MHNIGVIGAGMIAEHHIGAIRKTDGLDVTWLAAATQGSLDRVGDRFNIPNRTTHYEEILEDTSVDAVIISTPPSMHKAMFDKCLKAGKHVLLEKPAAISLYEIDEMIELSKMYPDRIVLDCSARHSRLVPKFNKVKEIIDSGALGEIYHIHHQSVNRFGRPGIEYHPTAKWFLNKAIAGGGPLFDWGVYDLSFHLGVLGDKPELKSIKHVSLKSGLDNCDAGTDVFDVEEMFVAMLEFTGGISYYWERAAHANMEAKHETRIYGTKGGIKLAFCSWDAPTINVYDTSKQAQTIEVDYSQQDDALALIQHFANVLDKKAEPAMPLHLARKHLDIIYKCYGEAEKA